MRWRIELVGGPFCGCWYPFKGELPEGREFAVRGFQTPVCIYFLETDELDPEQRASFVRSFPPMVPVQ